MEAQAFPTQFHPDELTGHQFHMILTVPSAQVPEFLSKYERETGLSLPQAELSSPGLSTQSSATEVGTVIVTTQEDRDFLSRVGLAWMSLCALIEGENHADFDLSHRMQSALATDSRPAAQTLLKLCNQYHPQSKSPSMDTRIKMIDLFMQLFLPQLLTYHLQPVVEGCQPANLIKIIEDHRCILIGRAAKTSALAQLHTLKNQLPL